MDVDFYLICIRTWSLSSLYSISTLVCVYVCALLENILSNKNFWVAIPSPANFFLKKRSTRSILLCKLFYKSHAVGCCVLYWIIVVWEHCVHKYLILIENYFSSLSLFFMEVFFPVHFQVLSLLFLLFKLYRSLGS